MLPAGSRRSKIRPPRRLAGNQDSESDYSTVWTVLASAIGQIQNKNIDNLLYEQLYRHAYTLVLRKWGGRLYEDVASLIGRHLRLRRQKLLDHFDSSVASTNDDFLKAVVDEWTTHIQLMKFVNDVLMYLNRVYVKEHKRMLVYDMGLEMFDSDFLRPDNLKVGKRVIDAVLAEIARSRHGHVITTRLYIAQVVLMLETLSEDHAGTPVAPLPDSLYQTHFETALMRESEQFFADLAQEYLVPLQGTSYLIRVHRFIQEEETRLAAMVPAETFPKVVALMNNVLIRDKLDMVMVLPAEQQGLLFWLQPLVDGVFEEGKVEKTGITGKSIGGGGSGSISTSVSGNGNGSTSISGNGSISFSGNDSSSSSSLDTLRVLYALAGRVDPERRMLKVRLKEAVHAQGAALASTASTLLAAGAKKPAPASAYALRWVDGVLEYHTRAVSMVRHSFSGDGTLEHVVVSAIRDFVNAGKRTSGGSLSVATSVSSSFGSSAELLAVYMDAHMKQAARPGSRSDAFVDRAVVFLRFVADKDAFEAQYAAHYARRYLTGKLTAGDAEDAVIARLGQELGSAAVEKLVRMRKDVALSASVTSEWKKEAGPDAVELELKICHVADWPRSMTKDYRAFGNEGGAGVVQTESEAKYGDVASLGAQTTPSLIWPRQLRPTMRQFEEFWTQGRRNDNKALFWSPRFGSVELRISYPSHTYDITMAPYAAMVMLLFAPQTADSVLAFGEKRKFTFSEILDLTNIPDGDLRRQLQLIAVAPRLRLLVKSPMLKDVHDTDVFSLNAGFKAPSTKVKVPTVLGAREKKSDNDEVQANILEGRKHLVNAAIVRIMKAGRTVSHNELIAQLVRQLHGRFVPTTLMMKQRIEDLIDKEYLKRDDDSPEVYHYIA